MGTTIHAIIEYDYTRLGVTGDFSPPFSGPTDSVIDLCNFINLSHGKDYSFFGAISGIRNETGIEPLYPLRGRAPNINLQTLESINRYFDTDGPCVGWLYYREINEALSHQGLTRKDLSMEVNLVLNMMEFLGSQLGVDTTRLVFGIE